VTLIDSLEQYLAVVQALRRLTPTSSDLWFRGIKDGALSILPGLYWRGRPELEPTLTISFMSMAPSHAPEMCPPVSETASSRWEWYFLMQHYGLPTRLLDWTENPLVALYFALDVASRRRKDVPCVWVLNPNALNRASVSDEQIVVPSGDFSSRWLFQTDSGERKRCMIGKPTTFKYGGDSYSNAGPLAIYPVRRNPRIIAQRGVFTVHGANERPLEKVLGVQAIQDLRGARAVRKRLARIDIAPSRADSILKSLELLQINRVALFPELPSLSIHVMEAHGLGRP